MKREIQLFHEVSGHRECEVIDGDVEVKDFVFSVVEELQQHDKEFFEVYGLNGELISKKRVGECPGPYVVVCEIISATRLGWDGVEEAVTVPGDVYERLHTFLSAFDATETCGLLIGRLDNGVQKFVLGTFPELSKQTLHDAVIRSQDVALIMLGAVKAKEPGEKLAFGWIHTHLVSPPRLSPPDRQTLARLRTLVPDIAAFVFNKEFRELGVVGYKADGSRVNVARIGQDEEDRVFAAKARTSIEELYRARGLPIPTFI